LRLVKHGLKSVLVQRAIAFLAAGYTRLVHRTTSWSEEGREIAERHWREGRPFVVCFWHGRMLMTPLHWDRRVPLHVLISRHRDGQLLAQSVRRLGFPT